MSRLRTLLRARHGEAGYTLIEVLVAMSLGIIVSGVAFSLLNFTTSDVSRISDRVRVDQTGRVALEKIMLALHSSCVAATINPIMSKSSGTTLRFISEVSPVNEHNEPISSLSTVRLHEVIYTAASGKTEGTLSEKSWASTGTTPEYKFNEKETPTTRRLLTGVKETEVNKKLVPIFEYYRYYNESDSKPIFGQLDPTAVGATSEKEAELVSKVTVSFTLVPEGKENKENTSFGNDRSVALEDSAILRLATSSETSSNTNYPCTQET
jgi:prepilin-type N-terminal cleavage/methylation domain-containing protein